MWLMLTCLGTTHHLSRDNMRLSDWMRCSHLVVTVAVFNPAPPFRFPQNLPITLAGLYTPVLIRGFANMPKRTQAMAVL